MPIQNPISNLLIAGVGGLRVQTLAGDAAQGDIYYLNANREMIRLPVGSSGQAILSTGTALAYGAPSPGGNAGGDLTGTFPNPTIANDAVSFAKMQNISTATLIGRIAAGTGDPEALTPAQGRSVLELGTAALANTGTGSGNVPVLDGSGLLNPSVLPPLAITSVQVVANQAARLALNNVQVGDVAKQTDNGVSYLLAALPASTESNWVSIGDTAIDAADIQSGVLAPGRLGTGTPSNGQVLVIAGGTPTWSSPPGGALSRVSVTGTTQQMSVNTVYHVNSASKATLTLPATASVGDVIEVIGVASAGWAIAQNASQFIRYLGTVTTTGTSGRLDCQLPGLGVQTPQACVFLECVATNTTWIVKSSIGILDIV